MLDVYMDTKKQKISNILFDCVSLNYMWIIVCVCVCVVNDIRHGANMVRKNKSYNAGMGVHIFEYCTSVPAKFTIVFPFFIFS